jgi:hypothetical protein
MAKLIDKIRAELAEKNKASLGERITPILKE